MRVFFVNLLLSLSAILISVFAGEIGVRIVYPLYNPSGQIFFHKEDHNKPSLGPPNRLLHQTATTGDYNTIVSFNQHGLRDKKNVANGTFDDLYMIGDSFAFGWGVDERRRFSNQFELLTKQRTFNLATPGDFENYDKHLKYARKLGANIRRIVVAVCMENDLKLYNSDTGGANFSIKKKAIILSLDRFKKFLKTHSAFYNFLSTTIHQNSKTKAFAKSLGLIVDINDSLPMRVFDLDIINNSLEKLLTITKLFDATFLIIPSRALWIGEEKTTTQKIHNAFVSGLKNLGHSVVDMQPIFELTDSPMQFYFQNDGHWTTDGHFNAALALQTFFSEIKK